MKEFIIFLIFILPVFSFFYYNCTMVREEYIDYLTLRAKECHYDVELVAKIHKALTELKMDDYDHLRRISESEFRQWCKSIKE